MSTENKMMPENARLAAVLADPDMILQFKTPSEKAQMAAVQRKPELIGHLPSATEKVQLVAVLRSAESILLMHAPSRRTCFMAVEKMLGLDLLPEENVLDAAERLVLRMKRDRNEGKPDTAAIEEFLTEVKPYKN